MRFRQNGVLVLTFGGIPDPLLAQRRGRDRGAVLQGQVDPAQMRHPHDKGAGAESLGLVTALAGAGGQGGDVGHRHVAQGAACIDGGNRPDRPG